MLSTTLQTAGSTRPPAHLRRGRPAGSKRQRCSRSSMRRKAVAPWDSSLPVPTHPTAWAGMGRGSLRSGHSPSMTSTGRDQEGMAERSRGRHRRMRSLAVVVVVVVAGAGGARRTGSRATVRMVGGCDLEYGGGWNSMWVWYPAAGTLV